MASIKYKNEIIKRKYFGYVRNSKGFSEKTIDCYDKAICLWEDFTHGADFVRFNKTAAEGFKTWLETKKKVKAEQEISVSYRYDILRHLRTFFDWLSKQKGYKQIDPTAIDYLRLSREEVSIATQPRSVEVPTLEEIKAVIENIKGNTEVEMRDKSMISLMFLTGARISAIRTLPMKSFNKDELVIDQNPIFGVKTKFSKRIITPLISYLYKEASDYFIKWFDYLDKEKDFKPNDPLFPATKIENGTENLSFHNTGQIKPVFWQSNSPLGEIIRKRFKQAGVKYYKPHAIRHSLIKRISKLHLTEEQRKAFSQSLGHEDVRTTFGSHGYGKIGEDKQIEIIKNIDFEGQSKGAGGSLNEASLRRIIREEMSKKTNDNG